MPRPGDVQLAPVGVQLLPVGVPLPLYSEFFSDAIGAAPGIRTFAGRITMVPAFGSTGTAGEKRGVLAEGKSRPKHGGVNCKGRD